MQNKLDCHDHTVTLLPLFDAYAIYQAHEFGVQNGKIPQ
jgi:hypothetical protein